MTPSPPIRQVAVIGGGPAGLMAAEILGGAGLQVTVFDRMPSVGRKFLMAGRGGLNLTHSEQLDLFLSRYGEAESRLRPLIEAFRPEDLTAWCEGLGQETFVGSSGRVFPRAFKASPLLRAWLARLDGLGVRFALRHRWEGWDDGSLVFALPDGGRRIVRADATLLALGGASWPRLGSDAGWVGPLREKGIMVTPLKPANVGFTAAWSDLFRSRFEGEPLKRIALSFQDRIVRGEAIVTAEGLEGGALYALSAPLREAVLRQGMAVIHIDLRPDLGPDALIGRLSGKRGGQSTSTFLRKAAGLSPVAVALLREGAGGPLPTEAPALAALIKAVPIEVTGLRPIERAISTAGGVALDEVDGTLMLKRLPGVFAAGEMLDWEAPTGGYLLQATFATGVAAAQGIMAYLRDSPSMSD